jgi:dihydrofolate reductase
MFEYWPGAETEADGSDINKRMARKMNAYKKYVFSGGSEKRALEWNNAEQVLVHNDEDLIHFIQNLKAQPGKDIHLSGGARLAQSMIRLELVDEYFFNVFPVVSAGAVWFDQIENQRELELVSATNYENGVIRSHYKSKTG